MSSTVKTCYRDTGLTAGEDIPCDPNAEHSACCGVGSTCIENLYCRDTSGNAVPGSCTDRYWGITNPPNPACPCRGHYKDDNSTLNYSDSVTFCPDGSVCCGVSQFTCCDTGKGFPRIQYGNRNIIPTGTASTMLASYYNGQKVTTLPVISTGSRTMTTTSTGSGTATATSKNTANESTGLSTAAKAGIGIAVGLLLLSSIAALFFLTRTWRKYTKLKSSKDGRSDWSSTPMPLPVDNSYRHDTAYNRTYDDGMRHSQTELAYVSGRKDPPTQSLRPVELAAHNNMF